MTPAPTLTRLSELFEQLSGGCSLEEAQDSFGADRMSGLCLSGLVKLHRATGFVDCTECGEPHSEPTRYDVDQRRWYWICRGEKHYLPAQASQLAQLDRFALQLDLQRILGLSDISRLRPDPTPETFALLGSIHNPDRTIFLCMSVNSADSLASLFAGVQRGSKLGGWILTLGPAPTIDPPRHHKWLDLDAAMAVDGAGELRLVDPLPWTADGQYAVSREDRHREMWAIFHSRSPSRRIDKKRRLGAEAEAISNQMPNHLKLQPGTIANLIGKAFWAEHRISHDKTHD